MEILIIVILLIALFPFLGGFNPAQTDSNE